MKQFFFILSFIIASCGDEVEELRKEIKLLREVIAIQNEQLLGFKGVAADGSKAQAASATISPTWSSTSYTSTFKTVVTVPVSTEVPITLHGRAITTTIVDYETKETVTSTVLPTSVLAYPKDVPKTVVPEKTMISATPTIKASSVEITPAASFGTKKPILSSNSFGSNIKSKSTSSSRLNLHKPDSRPGFKSRSSGGRSTSASRTSSRSKSNRANLSFSRVSSRSRSKASSRPASGRRVSLSSSAGRKSSKTSKAKSFSLTSSPFGGFSKSSFSRFKRQTVEPFHVGNYVELRSSMEEFPQ